MAVVACGSAGKLPLVVLRGFELTEDYLIKNGFRRPILVRCKDGLDLRVPPENFSVQDVAEHVGMVMACCCLHHFFDAVCEHLCLRVNSLTLSL